MRGAVLFVLQLSQNIVNAKSKKPWTGGRNKADLCCFLPLLFPHYSDTDIKQLKKDLKKAYGKFFKGVRASKDMFERWQIKHYILALKLPTAAMDFILIITKFCYLCLIPLKNSHYLA